MHPPLLWKGATVNCLRGEKLLNYETTGDARRALISPFLNSLHELKSLSLLNQNLTEECQFAP
jgi:hypothetical protein